MSSLADVGWKLLEFKARSKRSGSIYEPLKLSVLHSEDEPLWDKLDLFYRAVKSTILNYQSPTTGLFPVKTCSDCNEAKVRDSLYCAASSWALALAYRRVDDDMGRTHELEHSAIKGMRGILYCYMRQSDKVESFKQNPSPSTCLHSVFNVHTGDELYSYAAYSHLQIDAVSLFLLYMVEMICSGLQIIYNTDEVSFIQNLVFCVERAYRVPDFGMWERGSKYNNGTTELHSSSVGLAKAALEAINGFNLFGNQGCSWSVIFVDLDAHNRNRQTLCSLLPRESRSHNTDAALLPCISYPAFAVDDDALYTQTLDKIIRKLKGKYGFKRYLRDGYRTPNEDKNRRYYRPAEMKLFDGIECEFPIFFIYMMIDGVFRGNQAQVQEYQELLQAVIFESFEGHAVIPKYYYVPADFAEGEQRNPGSQKRFPSNSGRDGMLFLWGQALYNIAKLLVDGLISPKDLDPVHRYVAPEDQRNVSMRYSNQGPIDNDVVIYVALIAESQRLQVFLNTYGIQTQTPQQVEPIQIWPQQSCVRAYRFLAMNKKLGLSGRPERPVGCIGTCKIYRILGKTVVSYPIVFDLSDFYLSQDVMLLIDDIKNALQFIKQCWKMPGRPLFLVLIREDNIKGSRFNPVLDMLGSFKKGSVGGVKVHVDRLQTLISGAVVEQLDFLRVNEAEIPEFKSFEELELPKHSRVKRQTSTPNASDLEQQPEIDVDEWYPKPTHQILQKFHDCDCLASQAQLASILLKKEGPDFFSRDEFLRDELERIYRQAGSRKLWSVVRLAAGLLSKLVDSLAPSITSILVHGKQVTLGLFGHDEEVISNPLSPGVIKDIIYSKCSPRGEREAVLQQELVIHIGWIISSNPDLFSGMLKVRVGWIIQAMKHELEIRAGDLRPQDIYQMSPSDVKQLLLDVLQPQQAGRSWLNRRQIDGSLNRTPLGFYDRVWQILERTSGGIRVASRHLPQQPTLSDMTMYEMNFSLLVEDTLQNIVLPEYRQIIVELLMVVSVVLERNPELEFQETVDLDRLVKDAFADYQKDRGQSERTPKQDDMEAFYNTPALGKKGTSSYLTKVVMIQLLQGEMKPSKDDPCSVS
ncbi:phosphorylase b kinase regulatory subunit beta isoform X1 [Electrophorus electricus]|uniref:phosphorylase b kinase regulatory subunit beta isoform X1 n=1 Tax=Electrophorus electricus TaxID=8005 RepID=UPI0015D09B26|nr:phosphorylase b kinase regulatory subunit beta isoform X1 [Electrophorus electricus]